VESEAIESKNHIETYSIIEYPTKFFPEKYFGFFYKTFLQSFKFGTPFGRSIDNDSYYKNYHFYIESLIKRPNAYISIAKLSKDTLDTLLGWSFYEGDKLHYVYVDKDQRGQGIAKALTDFEIKTVTHMTKLGFQIYKNKKKGIIYDPWG
jgi:GNAT superfamily N-acetyltransferase